MPSDIDIVNLGLVMIGMDRIHSFTDQNVAAREANAIYAMTRDAEIRAHLWKFAIKRAQLAELSTPPAFGFNGHQYPLPSDYLRLIQAGDWFPGVDLSPKRNQDVSSYSIEQNPVAGGLVIITADTAPLDVRYICRVTDPTLFDDLFVEALAAKMGMRLCERITQSNPKGAAAKQSYVDAILMAIRTNAIEKPPSPLPDDTWVMSRNW